MKKLLILTLFFLTACSEDDDTVTVENLFSNPTIPIVESQYYIVDKLLDISLTKVVTPIIKTLIINAGDIIQVVKPSIVDLNNIQILNGKIINNTPYKIKSIHVILDGELVEIEFSNVILPYSQGSLSGLINVDKIINLTTISNSTFDYKAMLSGTLNSRHANDEERSTAEHVQMYDRFMMNAPYSLNEITQHLADICNVNNYCKNYYDTPENYALDTYFSKSMSGMNTHFWIDPDVWGMATMPHPLNMLTSKSNASVRIWMSPSLMGYVYSGNYSKEKEGWQALAHELYHNYGFDHDTGWPSNNGIDDIFGQKVVDNYLIDNSNQYITSNVIFDIPEKVDNKTFKFKLFANEHNGDDLKVRLLSTNTMKLNITQNGNNEVIITFKESPLSDVYVSFYFENDQQMATVSLNFVKVVSSNNELQTFNKNIRDFLISYNVIYINTRNGSWAKNFILPSDNIQEGKKINFKSHASFNSIIHHDGGNTLLSNGDELTFNFDGAIWQKEITSVFNKKMDM